MLDRAGEVRLELGIASVDAGAGRRRGNGREVLKPSQLLSLSSLQ